MTFKKQKDFVLWQEGQALLVIVLVIVVVSTVGLSLASRAITNLRTSTEEAESQKALAAAEAGIERALQGGVTIGTTTISTNTTYSTTVTEIKGNTFLLEGGNSIARDEGADLWLAPYDPTLSYSSPWSGNLTIYWGDSSKTDRCTDSALEIIIISGSKNSPISTRYAYDPCPARQGGNNFSASSVGATVTGSDGTSKAFPYGAIINGISSGLIARIIPIYENTYVGVVGAPTVESPPLPIQGYRDDATGTSGQTNRRIVVFNGWPQTYLPYLSYGLFVANSN